MIQKIACCDPLFDIFKHAVLGCILSRVCIWTFVIWLWLLAVAHQSSLVLGPLWILYWGYTRIWRCRENHSYVYYVNTTRKNVTINKSPVKRSPSKWSSSSWLYTYRITLSEKKKVCVGQKFHLERPSLECKLKVIVCKVHRTTYPTTAPRKTSGGTYMSISLQVGKIPIEETCSELSGKD